MISKAFVKVCHFCAQGLEDGGRRTEVGGRRGHLMVQLVSGFEIAALPEAEWN